MSWNAISLECEVKIYDNNGCREIEKFPPRENIEIRAIQLHWTKKHSQYKLKYD